MSIPLYVFIRVKVEYREKYRTKIDVTLPVVTRFSYFKIHNRKGKA